LYPQEGVSGILFSGRYRSIIRRKQDLLKNEEEPERDKSEQNVPEGKRGR
jgi:hypothetical protein